MLQELRIELPRPGRVESNCGEDTVSCPRHDITLPLCPLRITDCELVTKVKGSYGGKGLRKPTPTNPTQTSGSPELV